MARRRLQGRERAGLARPKTKSQIPKTRRFEAKVFAQLSWRSPQRAVHAVGCQPLASFCRLKWGLVQYGVVRFSGSTISVVTTSSDSPPGTSSRSKYSVITAFALYGTPFFRR